METDYAAHEPVELVMEIERLKAELLATKRECFRLQGQRDQAVGHAFELSQRLRDAGAGDA